MMTEEAAAVLPAVEYYLEIGGQFGMAYNVNTYIVIPLFQIYE